MDSRLEQWKSEYKQDTIPHGMHVIFNAASFPNDFPNFVKEAIGKIRVPLDDDSEFMGGDLLSNKDDLKAKPFGKNSEYTYQVKRQTFLDALNNINPKAYKWYKENIPEVDTLVFKANQIESLVD